MQRNASQPKPPITQAMLRDLQYNRERKKHASKRIEKLTEAIREAHQAGVPSEDGSLTCEIIRKEARHLSERKLMSIFTEEVVKRIKAMIKPAVSYHVVVKHSGRFEEESKEFDF